MMLNRKHPLNHQCTCTTPAVADTGYADTAVVLFQYGEQRNDDTCAGCAQWMSHRDCTTVHVYVIGGQAQFPVVGNGDHRKGLIYLVEIHLICPDTGALQRTG